MSARVEYALFERFELAMTRAEALGASHPGPCDAEVDALCRVRRIASQLDTLTPAKIRDELRGYGAWDETELADDAQNRARLVWIAAGDIAEELRTMDRGREMLAQMRALGVRWPRGRAIPTYPSSMSPEAKLAADVIYDRMPEEFIERHGAPLR